MNRFKGISQKFPAEAAAVGRLLAGYADLEISLLHCVQMARGGVLDAVLKAMFGTRGETRRINTASTLGQPAYDSVGLGSLFATAIDDMRFLLDISELLCTQPMARCQCRLSGFCKFGRIGDDFHNRHRLDEPHNQISRYADIDLSGGLLRFRG